MPPYLNLTIIDWRKLTTYYTRRKYSISVIVLHDGTGCTAQATLDALNDVQLSMHYIVDRNGTIYYLVDESNRAWHAGAGSWKTFNNINDVSIGIEVVGVGDEPFPLDQMQSLSSLCRRIIERYAIKAANIIGAYDSAPTRKTDPSGYFDWKLFNSLVGIYPHLFDSSQLDADQQREVLLESMPQSDARVRILQQQLNRVGYGFANIDGVFMQYTQSIVQAFNRHFCREVFIIEQVIANRTILDERNQRWYRVSQERLNYLLADMSSR